MDCDSTDNLDLRACFFLRDDLQEQSLGEKLDLLKSICDQVNEGFAQSRKLDFIIGDLIEQHCPVFDKYLNVSFGYYNNSETTIQVKLAMLKLIINQVIRSTSDKFDCYRLQKIVLLSGIGGSGKSVLTSVLRSLFPSAVSKPTSLSSRFENSRFVGKSAIFFQELPDSKSPA